MILLNQYRDKWLGEKFDEVIGFYTREFYCLDNFSSFKVLYKGYLYSSLEEAYQASKFLEAAPDIALMIKNSYSAYEAKTIASDNRDKQRKDWNTVKATIMEELLRLKLAQNPYVERKLLQTLDYPIVEDSPQDNYWGWGQDRNGRNKLGNLWMNLREELRKEYHMRLDSIPFDQMDSGEKKIEYRLNDEKRQQLRIGDIITFTKLPDKDKTLRVIVTDLKRYSTLIEMYEASFYQYLDKYYPNPQEVAKDTSYYTDAEVKEYGCLAIHVRKFSEYTAAPEV